MRSIKDIIATVAISAATTLGVVWGVGKYNEGKNLVGGQNTSVLPSNYKYAGFADGTPSNPTFDFTAASQSAIPTVVHIKTKAAARQTNNLPRQNNPFSDFFGDDILDQLFGGRGGSIPEQRASGSGVLVSDNGYIVTNNHVISRADDITVTLSNKRQYKAKLVGAEPAYDLAVLKIEDKGLPYLVYGNSDDVQIGQWVLAIGYPLNLETTVTAGIVSAKGRSIGLNRDRAGQRAGAVESYIQTDAAVNPGNSGGALINTDGKLIGINAAIASPTGSYAGYSYAIPVNITKKVVDDIIKYGTVQRGFLGVQYAPASDMSADEKRANGIPENAFGVYITDVPTTGAAYAAGIKKGDILTAVNGVDITSGPEMQEQIARFKPGDKINIGLKRGTQNITTVVTLKNEAGNFEVVKKENVVNNMGADFINLDNKKATDLGLKGGVVVKNIHDKGAISQQTRMRDGFVVLKVNGKDVKTVEEFTTAIGDNKRITISGVYPGFDGLYDYQIMLD